MRRLAFASLAALALLAGCDSGSARPGVAVSPSVAAVATSIPSPTPSPSQVPMRLAGSYALQVVGAFSDPVWVGAAPGDPTHLYLVERTGRVRQLDAAGKPLGTVLDVSGLISRGNEQGLLSIAFDPAYPINHRMYADYTDKAGSTIVMAYAITGDIAGPGQQLLVVPQPFPNHNGGLVLFDRTGMLLVGLGDGGSAGDPGNRAQDLHSDLGKILRINPVNGAGAEGNPYPGNPLVWQLGLRNPWRFSFDSDGYLWVGDDGQNTTEELDVVAPAYQRGANYGWSVYEGDNRFKPDQQFTPGGTLIAPALTYPHDNGGCSITGGEVYHGRALPLLTGKYVYGDYCLGELMATTRTSSGVTPAKDIGVKIDGLQAFGHDLNGELLVLSSDSLLRLVPGGH